ncbi:MAG TPA: histidine phosphatase family protein [Egibacteraceae bacterium]|nr:histidine phosphatase family protein [Egibacteraceae bacterium]
MQPPPSSREYRQYRFRLPPGATDLLLIRHGESEPARPDKVFPERDGHADPPLDPHGRMEAEAVAKRLADQDIAAVYVSTLQRTHQTAEPLCRALALEPVVEADIREVHLGEWEGGTFRMRVDDGDPLAKRLFTEERWDVIPGAEPMEALAMRVRDAINRIAASHADQRVAVFTHGGIIGTVAALATGGRPFAFIGADNASITHLVVIGDRWVLRRFNDTGHLATDLDRPVQPLT